MDLHKEIEICITLLTKNHYKKNFKQWKQGDFIQLSERIFEQTSVSISYKTLIRFLKQTKKDKEYIPRKSTLDAIAEYLSFESWEQMILALDIANKSKTTPPLQKNTTSKTLVKKGAIISAFILIAAVMITFINNEEKKTYLVNAKISITDSILKVPANIKFKFDIPEEREDPIFMNFGYDKNERELINLADTQMYKTYIYSGIFEAKLYDEKDNILDYQHILLYSDEAQTSFDYGGELQITHDSISFRNDYFKIPESHVRKFTQDSYWTKYRFFDTTDIFMDDFKFECTLKNTSVSDNYACKDIIIEMFGYNDTVLTYFISPHCHQNIQLHYGTKKKNGRTHNLNAFAKDFNEWSNISIQNLNDKFSVAIGDSIIFTDVSDASHNEILGIIITFKASGAIKSFSLKSAIKGQKYTKPLRLNKFAI